MHFETASIEKIEMNIHHNNNNALTSYSEKQVFPRD